MKVWLPRDAAARALGADDVAEALVAAADARGIDLTLIRNGSRGMIWLEPLLEIDTPEGRVGFGPVTPADLAMILDAQEAHPKALGPVEALPARVDGETVMTPLGRFPRPDGEATDWQLLVRPGDVRLADQGVAATVVARRFAGHTTAVTVAMAGPEGAHRLTVSHAGPAPAEAQTVSLVLDAGRAVIVPV